jgi:hypothetical protein
LCVDFNVEIKYCAGTNENILWGEVDRVGDEMFWCRGGAKLPLEPAVIGTKHEPFFLVSLAGATPTLNAIQLDRSDVNITSVQCLYGKDVFEQCSAGTRSKELSVLEKLMIKFG